jgi:transcriptional regulator with XRE-family HTH domain
VNRATFAANIGADLKRQREALKLSSRAVADAIGVTGTTIANWEAGRGVMSAFSRERLRAFLKAKWAERERQVQEEKVRAVQEVAP